MNNTNSMASRGTKGGLARATILSKNRRIEIAKKAAETKWMKKREESQKKDIMQVLEGFKNVLRIADVSIPCAIVQGPNGIKRVLSEFGVTKAILGTGSGASKKIKKASIEQGAPLPIFVAPSQLKPFINDELLDGPLKPIDYLDIDQQANQPALANYFLTWP